MPQYWDDDSVRAQASSGANQVFDEWASLASQHLGMTVPLAVASRYDCPNPYVNQPMGSVNTSTFGIIDGQKTLIIWLEEFGQPMFTFDEVLISHEVAHRILSLKGFCSLGSTDPLLVQPGAMLYSLAQHSPLYQMQDSLGINSRSLVDQRAHDLAANYVNQTVVYGVANPMVDGIIVADDILHASPALSKALRYTTLPSVPTVQHFSELVINIASQFDLHDKSDNEQFLIKAGQEIAPSGKWQIADGLLVITQEFASVT